MARPISMSRKPWLVWASLNWTAVSASMSALPTLSSAAPPLAGASAAIGSWVGIVDCARDGAGEKAASGLNNADENLPEIWAWTALPVSAAKAVPEKHKAVASAASANRVFGIR